VSFHCGLGNFHPDRDQGFEEMIIAPADLVFHGVVEAFLICVIHVVTDPLDLALGRWPVLI
jgi:hypothetical protein